MIGRPESAKSRAPDRPGFTCQRPGRDVPGLRILVDPRASDPRDRARRRRPIAIAARPWTPGRVPARPPECDSASGWSAEAEESWRKCRGGSYRERISDWIFGPPERYGQLSSLDARLHASSGSSRSYHRPVVRHRGTRYDLRAELPWTSDSTMISMKYFRIVLALLGGTHVLYAQPSASPTVKSMGLALGIATDSKNCKCHANAQSTCEKGGRRRRESESVEFPTVRVPGRVTVRNERNVWNFEPRIFGTKLRLASANNDSVRVRILPPESVRRREQVERSVRPRFHFQRLPVPIRRKRSVPAFYVINEYPSRPLVIMRRGKGGNGISAKDEDGTRRRANESVEENDE
ncbi:hypothetical protein KM043_000356 [Ampulex compressa]|nr:hypothetical protein KM043_000356 [Ampulex compressa]